MIWILSLPALILPIISLMVGIAILYSFYRTVRTVIGQMKLYFETRYQPKIIHLNMSDDEIKRKYREIDNGENGFNPLRQTYALIELFPNNPMLDEIKARGERLFPRLKFEFIKDKSSYQVARDYFLIMLLERTRQIDQGLWNSDKEKQWTDFPCRPKQMAELDSYYLDWVQEKMGRPLQKTARIC